MKKIKSIFLFLVQCFYLFSFFYQRAEERNGASESGLFTAGWIEFTATTSGIMQWSDKMGIVFSAFLSF